MLTMVLLAVMCVVQFKLIRAEVGLILIQEDIVRYLIQHIALQIIND